MCLCFHKVRSNPVEDVIISIHLLRFCFCHQRSHGEGNKFFGCPSGRCFSVNTWLCVCLRVRIFEPLYLRIALTYFNETRMGSWKSVMGQRSRLRSDDHGNPVNAIAHKPLKGFEPKLTQIVRPTTLEKKQLENVCKVTDQRSES